MKLRKNTQIAVQKREIKDSHGEIKDARKQQRIYQK